jgi:hypothetical protein
MSALLIISDGSHIDGFLSRIRQELHGNGWFLTNRRIYGMKGAGKGMK